jgi:hypothetical protein
LKKEITEKMIEIMAPYVPPAEIEEHFGIKYKTLDSVCRKHSIPKWRKSYSTRKDEAMETWKNNENITKERCIEDAIRVRDGST